MHIQAANRFLSAATSHRLLYATLIVTAALLTLLHSPIVSATDLKPLHCLAGLCAAAAPETRSQWLIAPYLWAPTIKGAAQIDATTAEFDYEPEELAGGINAGAMGFVQRHRGKDFFYLEGLGFRYKDRISAFQDKLLNAQLALVEIGYGRSYCIGSPDASTPCRLSLNPYIGLRQTEMDIGIRLNEGGAEGLLLQLMGIPDELTANERWLDPALGLIVQYRLTEKLTLYTKTDAAGFDVGYNDYWNALGVLFYQFSPHWAVAGGYRVADFDAQPGGGNDLRLELHGEGPMAGLIYSF